ncbi:hypothetical protein [Dietzia sp. 179-F 9C3 NHS]|uniref:hypothetical protein n=1 Tax=Dietzia sp. 179-F 9C3 NHS TaxID=3374295 RepID=UPI003879C237
MIIRLDSADDSAHEAGANDLSISPGTSDSYVSTGHIRTALRYDDGVVVVFRDGIVTAGPWADVCRAYAQPMQRVFGRQELDLLVGTGGVTAAAQVANMQFVDLVVV